jgi:hypothetical protein
VQRRRDVMNLHLTACPEASFSKVRVMEEFRLNLVLKVWTRNCQAELHLGFCQSLVDSGFLHCQFEKYNVSTS